MDSDAEKQQVRVVIYNQTYMLRAPGDPAETEKLAQFVDELMSSVAARAGNVDASRVGVITCLHLADRLRAMERELDDLRDRVEQKSRDFSVMLDRALGE